MKSIYKWTVGAMVVCGFQFATMDHTFALTDKAVTPEQYGANGSDNLPDTAALQRALNVSKNVVLKGGATYYINKPLTVDHTIKITTTGGKANIVKTTMRNKEVAFTFHNETTFNTVMWDSAKKGQEYIIVYSTKGVKAGDLVHLKSSKLWKWDNRGYLSKGELLRVSKVEKNKIYFETPLRDSYYVTGEKVTVTGYEDKQLIMENVSFSYPQPFNANKPLVLVEAATNSKLENVEVRNSKTLGILLDRTYKTTVNRMYANLGTTKDINSGYGIQDYGGLYTRVTNSYFTNVRRGIDFSGVTPSRSGYAANNTAVGPVRYTLASGNSGYGTHSTAEDILFEDNTSVNFNYGYISRGDRITIRNNTAYGTMTAMVAASYGDHINVYNNFYKNDKGGNAEQFLRVVKTFDGNVSLRHNYAGVLTGDFVQNDSPYLKSLQLYRNRAIFIHKASNPAYLIKSLGSVKLENTLTQDNLMTMRVGKKAFSSGFNLTSNTNKIDWKY
ncbi:right-handed parallel beta-helix repeat-containing protein [Priestia megaterium]|uniref:right-handed parallel beta-helix repeat-containing protein n=1 Tax=Priestia megaterium TaxID=1404 RepID=UPI003100F805